MSHKNGCLRNQEIDSQVFLLWDSHSVALKCPKQQIFHLALLFFFPQWNAKSWETGWDFQIIVGLFSCLFCVFFFWMNLILLFQCWNSAMHWTLNSILLLFIRKNRINQIDEKMYIFFAAHLSSHGTSAFLIVWK